MIGFRRKVPPYRWGVPILVSCGTPIFQNGDLPLAGKCTSQVLSHIYSGIVSESVKWLIISAVVSTLARLACYCLRLTVALRELDKSSNVAY
jgi:hypothetical protein